MIFLGDAWSQIPTELQNRDCDDGNRKWADEGVAERDFDAWYRIRRMLSSLFETDDGFWAKAAGVALSTRETRGAHHRREERHSGIAGVCRS